MNELHLLDILAARHGCFISDLNLAPFLRREALSDFAQNSDSTVIRNGVIQRFEFTFELA